MAKTKPEVKPSQAKKKKPIQIMDTTFRDGHQSLWATRMRIEDMLPILREMDEVGFCALEVWGGATFDVTHRYLNEDPWERLATLKKGLKKTPLQMLLRGQNLVGYRNYADDVVRAFVLKTAELGMDIFRVFDALNDERNFETSFRAIKEAKKHIQGTICYSLTERRMGGPVFNLEYYLKKARTLEDMGADSLCIKDMAGLLAPLDAFELIRNLKATVKIPIQLHTHYTSGMGSMTYLMAIEAGVDVIDTALAPFALRSSQPAIEPILVAIEGTDRDPKFDLNTLYKLGAHLEQIAPKYRDFMNLTQMSVIDIGVLLHQIPGGMLSNLVSQLKEAGALDRLKEVYEELPRTRKDLGYPPLVTPTSQIVGIQAVQNVLFGRYKMISAQVKDYAYGLYGRPPVPMDKEVQKLCLKGYERGEQPITGRPGDVLEPELEKAKAAVKEITRDPGDTLIYALYPTTGMKFLRWKYGLEAPPPSVKPKTLEDVKKEDAMQKLLKEGKLVPREEKPAPPKGPGLRSFHVFVDDAFFNVEVEPAEASPRITSVTQSPRPGNPAPRPTTTAAPAAASKPAPSGAGAMGLSDKEFAMCAPMAGMIIEYKVKVGDPVKKGDVVLVQESMKMQNNLEAPVDGTIAKIPLSKGSPVSKGEVVLVIAT
jgi:pyruvate carboxylase subunit B